MSVFEVFLVFGIVGFSMNLIFYLIIIGKVIIIFMMFFGKMGFLILVFLFVCKKNLKIKYLNEDILIG